MKFSDLDLHPKIQENLKKINFVDCTPIQDQAIPVLLQGKDVAGLAQTGTGKTAAFLLPLIDRILRSLDDPKSPRGFPDWKKRNCLLVLVPTRELADQVYENALKFLPENLSACAIYGGTTYDKQKAALKSGVEVVIATPGRLIDLYKEHHFDMGQVRAVVFDEADRMFDMGFKDDMKFVLRRLPRDRQFLVFSATLNFDVLNVAYEFGAEPIEINISRDQAKAEHVKDQIFHVGQDEKASYLLSILKKFSPRQAIIFSNFKHNVERITAFLNKNGQPAMGISSLLTQAQRNRVMEQFKAENDRNILVATDLAARGLDILGVDMVINYELPEDPENYVHRIGRTGRAGQEGSAYSFVSDRDVDSLARIETFMKNKIDSGWLDDAEIVKQFEPFPRDERPRHSGPPRGAGRGGPRDDRGPRRSPPRGGEGRDRPRDRDARGPRDRDGRDNRDQQGRDRNHHRDRDRGPRPDAVRAESTGTGQPSTSAHRDRQTGRHRDHNRGDSGADRNRSDHQHGDKPNENRSGQGQQGQPRSQGQGGQRRHGSGGGGGRDRDRRPNSGGGQGGQRRDHRRGHPAGNGSDRKRQGSQSAARGGSNAKASSGIGGKVTGLIKRLFGRKPKVPSSTRNS